MSRISQALECTMYVVWLVKLLLKWVILLWWPLWPTSLLWLHIILYIHLYSPNTLTEIRLLCVVYTYKFNKVMHVSLLYTLISAEAIEGNLTGLTLRMLPSREVIVGLTLSLAVSYTIFIYYTCSSLHRNSCAG